jgi:hypothetical protein
MISREGMRGRLRDTLEHVKAGNSDQVELHVRDTLAELRRLIKPIRDPSVTGSRSARPPIYAAESMGLGIDRVTDVIQFVEDALSSFARGDIAETEVYLASAIERWDRLRAES